MNTENIVFRLREITFWRADGFSQEATFRLFLPSNIFYDGLGLCFSKTSIFTMVLRSFSEAYLPYLTRGKWSVNCFF